MRTIQRVHRIRPRRKTKEKQKDVVIDGIKIVGNVH